MISVQQADFDSGEEIKNLQQLSSHTGAVATFIGTVRNTEKDVPLKKLILDYYPGMTEKSLNNIIAEAKQKWRIIDAHVIHRVGELNIGDQIVFVGVASEHRQDAFSACQFIMDFLKTSAPFWKKAVTEEGEYWIEAKSSDQEAMTKWQK